MIVAAYRIKNESRWIAESLMRTLAVADQVIVFDDYSTDDTVEIARSFPGVRVFSSEAEGFDEARDRGFVLKQCIDAGARWILTLDGDEVLTPSAIREIRDFSRNEDGGILRQRIAYLWDTTTQERCDDIFNVFLQNIFWSVFDEPELLRKKLVFKKGYTSRRHCGRSPKNHSRNHPSKGTDGKAAIKHYGYLYDADRKRKYLLKSQADPVGEQKMQYGHIIGKPTRLAPGPVMFRPFQDV